jgi:hypothetical protein
MNAAAASALVLAAQAVIQTVEDAISESRTEKWKEA